MLHTVNKSPFERNTFDTCLAHVKKGSAILLIEDGVYAAMKGTNIAAKVEAAAKDIDIFVLGPDLKARGIGEDRLIAGVKVVEYGGFVDLVVEKKTMNAWL